MSNFDKFFDRIIGYEGGYTNDPDDPGGETKWGISKREYPNFIIKDLTRDDARDIYRRDFWSKLEADNLPVSVSFQLFDFAVHSGIGTAIRYFQRALNVADDGYFGPISKHAVTLMTECDIILRLNSERIVYLTRLAKWPKYGIGWMRRIASNLNYGALDTQEIHYELLNKSVS